MGESAIVNTDGSSVNLTMLQVFWVVLFFWPSSPCYRPNDNFNWGNCIIRRIICFARLEADVFLKGRGDKNRLN